LTYIFISHFTDPTTGAHFRLERLIRYLAKESNDCKHIAITPITYNTDKFINLITCLNKWAIPVSLRMILSVIYHFKSLYSLRNSRCIVVTFGETNLLASYLVKLLTNGRLSIGVRSNVPYRHKIKLKSCNGIFKFLQTIRFFILNKVWRYIYHKCDQITVQTDLAKKEFIANYKVSGHKVEVINNDIPTEFESQAIEMYSDVPEKLLFIGNNSYIKGFDLLCNLLNSELSNKFKKVTIIGIKKGENYGINFDGEIEIIERTQNIQKYMSEHDLLIVPSREDQFPNVVLEALAIKLPIIGSSVDGIKFMLDNEFLLFEPDNFNSIEECIKRVTTIEGYRKCTELIKQRRELFRFDWSQEYLNTVNNI